MMEKKFFFYFIKLNKMDGTDWIFVSVKSVEW